MHYPTCIFVIVAFLSLSKIPTSGESVEHLNAEFEKSKSALSRQHASDLINYLKENPEADDFGKALDALAELDIPEGDNSTLRELMEKRYIFVEAQLNSSKDPRKALVQTDELLKITQDLGKEDDTLRLLEKKYDLLLELPEGKERLEGALSKKGVVGALINQYKEKRMKARGLAFLDRVKKDFPMITPGVLAAVGKDFASMDTVGQPLVLDFKSTDGKEINLTNYKGKVVLVDFWATWCVPCVRAIPEVLSLYERYHSEGFEVLGISLDQDREALQQFVNKKKIPWPQFFDGKAWDNELAVAHGISAIPATLLIGRDNKLAAFGLHGNELETKVVQLLLQNESSNRSEPKGPR